MKNLTYKTLALIVILSVYRVSDIDAQKHNTLLNATQIDSIAQDSVARVIASEEVATLVPSFYASLIVEVNAEIYPQIRAANEIVNDPEIDLLQQDYNDLSRLTDYVISRNNVLEGIESLTNQWESNLQKIEEYTEDLKSRTNDLVQMKRDLADQRIEWVDRRSKLRYGTHLDQVDTYVQTSIDTIDFIFEESASTLDAVTITYTQLTELQLKTQKYVDVLRSIRHDRLNKMLRNRGDFIWKKGVDTEINELDTRLNYLRAVGIKDTQYYIKGHKSDIANTIAFFIFITIVFYWTRHRSMKMDDSDEPEIVRNAHVLGRPMTMSVLFTIIASTFLLPNKPPLFNYVMSLLILYCILSILVNMLRKPVRWTAFVLAGLFVLLQVIAFVRDDNQYSRWLSLAASAVLFYMLFWIQRNKSRFTEHTKLLWQRIYVGLSSPLLVLSLLAFGANIIGYAAIAELINKGIIFTLIIALLLVAMYQSIASILFHFLDTAIAKKSIILRENGRDIFHKIMTILGAIISILYGYYCLNFFLLWELVYNIFKGIWSFGYEFGSVILTVGDLITVFITIVFFWIFANFVQIIMRRELFPRFNLPRGVGNAVASITHYSLIVVGIFLALAAAGFEMKHLGLLIGALGVGIGFGLQNIVNNFLSGLILIFERPITVDDVVEVDGTLGVVTSIGIRASRIRQYNGDEMIVPNADLISKKVTNRTLSDTKRRYTMNFETGRDENPEHVIAVISAAAQSVDGILSDPPAKGYFKGLGEQSIKFYVNYWGTGNFLDLMSGVEQAVFTALAKEGIKMPIPVQIEVQKKDVGF